MDFKFSAEAERFYQYDTPFLQRYLRLWIAIFVSRMSILLLLLAAVVLLLFTLMPLVYRWYLKLRAFDPVRHKAEGTEYLQVYPAGLKEIKEKVSRISVTLSYSEELYHLRMHYDMLRSKLEQMIESYDHSF